MTFLDQAAKHIFEKHSLNQLSRVCVVIPSRRGVLYFKQALARLADKPFLAPDVLAIDDFVAQTSGLKQIDQVALLFELYDVFKEIDPLVVFERFMTWAPTLLTDFDKIDQYLVNAKALFSFMSEAKALERWQMQLGESGRTIKGTPRTDRYFKLFENIDTVYANLRHRLNEKGLVYRGMAYRMLAENVEHYLLDKNQHSKYYFVGFNALSDAEEKIIRTLLKKKDFAETIWDSDSYYLNNTDQKAGDWLRTYKKGDDKTGKTPLFNNEWTWEINELLTGHKNIQIMGVANASMQAKVAGHIFNNWKKDEAKKVKRAIVLGDENLLSPVMNALDDSVEQFNITMGLSLKNSMLFTLIEAMFDMQRNLVEFKNAEGDTFKIPKYSHKQVIRILNHPFVRKYEEINLPLWAEPSASPLAVSSQTIGSIESSVETQTMATETIGSSVETQTTAAETINPIKHTIQEITEKNKVFLSQKELLELGNHDPLFEVVFTHWHNDPKKAIKVFYQLTDLLRAVYKENQDAVETEFLYQFYLILQRMEVIVNERSDTVSIRSFRTFLYELIKQTKIPFESDTDENLQIMGMLETRTLDFDQLIILSVNEGKLPLGKRQNTLIPFDALADPQFNLPTHNHADAVMSYHFFRLLQRAKDVVLVHVLPSDTYGAADKSRFLLQIEYELKKLNPNLNVTYPELTFDRKENTVQEEETKLAIAKTPDIIAFIESEIAVQGVYPSHINQFLDCSLRYYFSQVARIQAENEVEEQVGADAFGNWIHKTFENIDADLVAKGGLVEKTDIENVLGNLNTYLDEAFAQTNQGRRANEGMNYIMREIGQSVVRSFFQYQLKNESFPIEILDVEKQLNVFIEVPYQGRKIPLKVAGRIDRIDRVNQHQVRVIDYKTGKVEAKDLKINREDIPEKFLEGKDQDKIRQLWLYKYMVMKLMLSNKGLTIGGMQLRPNENIVNAGIYSLRNIEEGLLHPTFEFTENETPADFIQESEKYLTEFVHQLLDPSQEFTKTSDTTSCQYCDYRSICGR